MRATIILALALQACGPKSTPTDQPGDGPTNTTGPDSHADAAGCPANFDVAMHGRTCTTAGSRCTYAEAECTCLQLPACMGIDPGPDYQYSYAWSCEVHDPSLLRADGCPAKLPEQGQRCRNPGQVCHYSPYCAGLQSTATCSGRAWQIEEQMISPPPSMERP